MRASRSYFVRQVRLPLQAFIHTESSSGALLMGAVIIALVWANSPWSSTYEAFWSAQLSVNLPIVSVSHDLKHWVNDGLMALFFFVVALEIKRELIHGELSTWRKAAAPAFAALGGMLVPVVIYMMLNAGSSGASGWAIPMATDIAFSLGVLALVGSRIPQAARIFLLGLAVVDDIGAIGVIAGFYAQQVSALGMFIAVALVGCIVVCIRLGVRFPPIYVILAVLLWLATAKSGLHPSIAGVVLGLLAPAESYFRTADYPATAEELLESYRDARARGDREKANSILGQLEELTRGTEAPIERMERLFHPWANYVILPLFALANAGLDLSAIDLTLRAGSSVTLGVILGLSLGKPLGILGFTFIADRVGLASLPKGLTWEHVLGVGIVSGIGFTMSIFIANLGFDGGRLLADAKTGIFAASTLAAVFGYLLLRLSDRPQVK